MMFGVGTPYLILLKASGPSLAFFFPLQTRMVEGIAVMPSALKCGERRHA
jgi:hypothetical protein